MKTKVLFPFLALSLGLTWGIAAMLIVFADQVTAIFGEIDLNNPLVILAVYAPGFAGLFLVLWNYGLKGLGNFLSRLALWRTNLGWGGFLILGIPAIVYTGAAIKGTINDPFPYPSFAVLLPVLLHYLFLGPIEEFGWRGLALPLLQRKFSPFWAGLILGVIWALWHVPAFLIGGMPQTAWAAGPYFLGIIAISIIMTPYFNASNGSLLLAVLYHFQMMNPIFPDAEPYDNLIYIAVAVIVVVLNRKTMFKKGTGITEVLISEQNSEAANEVDDTAKNSLSATA